MGMISLKVDNLTYRTSPDTLRRVFEKYGRIGDVYIPRDRFTKASRGFAFVRFYCKNHAEDALDAVDGVVLDGRKLRVQMAYHDGPPDLHYGRRCGKTPPPEGKWEKDDDYGRSRSPRRQRFSRASNKSRSRSPRRRRFSRDSNKSRSRSPRRRFSRTSNRSRSRSPRRRRLSHSSKSRSRSARRRPVGGSSKSRSRSARRRPVGGSSKSRSRSPRRRGFSRTSNQSRSCTPRRRRFGCSSNKSRSPSPRRRCFSRSSNKSRSRSGFRYQSRSRSRPRSGSQSRSRSSRGDGHAAIPSPPFSSRDLGHARTRARRHPHWNDDTYLKHRWKSHHPEVREEREAGAQSRGGPEQELKTRHLQTR
ncbi:Serine/arginine-rich splicing factor 2 [Tupaia chinensis]|uniref:Serine/arginine-rich splicing factor 2 n=1 Tax=Tupaia chinensis TaxID=246437 RepID=L8Y905_TUPCH|nr:Serine/arginine-rich splicing factor 2 [Tupaia chinensis]